MQETADFFPLGIATGGAFCNRQAEREHLLDNLKKHRHTLLVSPRRYGKTSLALQVLDKADCLYAATDFLLASDDRAIEESILETVGGLVARLMPMHKKAMTKLKSVMSAFSPKFTLSDKGFKVELSPGEKPKQTIVEVLEALDRLAGTEKKPVVLFMDEFQQIATLKNNKTLEAAIRHAAERAKNITYIFSGSNRHLLMQMFDSSERALYHLCDRLVLDRIAAKHYQTFIQKAAKKKWRKTLAAPIIESILMLTRRHPYYVNVLCGRLWRERNVPTLDRVAKTWSVFVEEERNRIAIEVGSLSANQRAVIVELAKRPTNQPSSKAFLAAVRLSSASNIQALQVLQEKDLIYRDEEGLMRPLNPVIEHIVAKG